MFWQVEENLKVFIQTIGLKINLSEEKEMIQERHGKLLKYMQLHSKIKAKILCLSKYSLKIKGTYMSNCFFII